MLACGLALGTAWAGAADDPPTEADEVAALRAEIDELRAEYDARLGELERRLAALADDAETPVPAPLPAGPAAPGDELAALRAAAAAAAGTAPGAVPSPPAPATEATVGHERNLSLFNPEISVTGIFLGRASDVDREELENQEFELDLQSALDPFSRMRLTLALDGDELEVEEGWVRYSALPGGLDLLAGRFRQRFGALNRQHLHALPQSGYPLPIELYLGEEGLAQTGVSLSWLVPRPWSDAAEVTLEVTDGDGEAFAGEDFQQLALLGHVKSYWDLSPAAWFEVGLSGAAGEGPAGDERRIWGTDLTWHWQPPSRARYRELTWRGEVLLSQRELGDADDADADADADAWGAYTYLEGLARENLSLGVRLDGAEHPDDPARRAWAVTPYVTWWQSEYVRLRAEISHLDDEAREEAENRLLLQLTWAAGPHKHDTY
jgi:hypothetical protein